MHTHKQQVKYIGQELFSSNVICPYTQTHTHTCTRPIVLFGPLKSLPSMDLMAYAIFTNHRICHVLTIN